MRSTQGSSPFHIFMDEIIFQLINCCKDSTKFSYKKKLILDLMSISITEFYS